MGRRRRGKPANISFFAFQDIITSVSGILLLIVMLLILMLEQPGLLPTVAALPQLSLKEMEQRAAQAMARLLEAETLKLRSADLSEAELKAQIATLQGVLKDPQPPPQDPDLRVQLESARQEMAAREATMKETTTKLDQIRAEAEKTKKEVETSAVELTQAEGAAQIWLNRGQTEQQPIPIEVNEQGAVWRDFAGTETAMNGAQMLALFRARLTSTDKGGAYLVFFVRPGGVENFRLLRAATVEEGFSLGHSPLAEGTEIKLSPPAKE